MDHILQFIDKEGICPTWSDDVDQDKDIKNIRDLFNFFRNAACHSGSPLRKVGESEAVLVFNTIRGKMPNAMKICDKIIGCDYEDDIAFNYGGEKIYLIRHIKRIINELIPILQLRYI